MGQILISAAHKSSGKTTLSIGLCAALRQRGVTLAPFKKGPDFIDPMWLQQAAGAPCYNLDFFTMSGEEIIALFQQKSKDSEFALVEGNKGLYDGLDLDGSNSNAALARLLNLPVVLVIDAQGMTRGIAPLILGYQAFDRDIRIAGVILNKLGGSRHESKLRQVIEHYTEVPVIGAVHRHPDLHLLERHLGLLPSNESPQSQQQIQAIAKVVSQEVDLNRLLDIGNAANAAPDTGRAEIIHRASKRAEVRIAVARDAAFGFYYPDDLQALQQCGAEIVPVDMLHDAKLPDHIDALIIGGGFPETHLDQLADNQSLRAHILQLAQQGLPIYAECGGLMYLCRRLSWNNQSREMVGVIPADCEMHSKPQGRGYVKLKPRANHPWPQMQQQDEIRCHEFHYSKLVNLDAELEYVYDVSRGMGIDGRHDGIRIYNVLANYTHMRHVGNNPWVPAFVDWVRNIKLSAAKTAAQPISRRI